MHDDEFWNSEIDAEAAGYIADGVPPDTALQGAIDVVNLRRQHLAGRAVTWTFPGKMVYDVDGLPAAMGPNLISTHTYDDAGRGDAAFTDRRALDDDV